MNNLKIFFIVIFIKLFFSSLTFSQLEGYYKPFTEDGLLIFDLEQFEFTKNLFQYYFYSDPPEWVYGHGEYKIKNNELILTFTEQLDTFKKKYSYYIITDSSKSTDDTNTYHLLIVDYCNDYNLVKGAFVKISDSNNTKYYSNN